MILELWAMERGIALHHIAELRTMLGLDGDAAPLLEVEGVTGSEARQQSLIRLEAPNHGMWLTRNNVGALQDVKGRWMRFGLANESKAQNAVFKSADLIGIQPVEITPAHVGSRIGQFVAIECKEEGWTFDSTDGHSAAQKAFLDFVVARGGKAQFATGPASIWKDAPNGRP